MAIELVTEHTDDREFMADLQNIIKTAISEQEPAVITVSQAFELGSNSDTCVLEASLAGDENISLTVDMDTEMIIDLLEWIQSEFKVISEIPAFAHQQLIYLMQNTRELGGEHQYIQDQVSKHVYSAAEYNGFLGQLKVFIEEDQFMRFEYNLFASITADTSKQELELLKSKGLGDLEHKTSDPHKLIPILQFSTSTMRKLLA